MKNVKNILLLTMTIIVFSCEKQELAQTDIEQIDFKSITKTKGKSLKAKLVAKEVAFSKREGHTSVTFDHKMWVIGGYSGNDNQVLNNEVWSSKDGANWVRSKAIKHFSPRTSHAAAVFNNHIWVIAGNRLSDGGRTNDVWHSKDGQLWQQATGKAKFSPRSSHTSLAFDNKLWVIGGLDQDKKAQNDIWYSKNGVDWIQATPKAAFPPRFDHTSFIYKGMMWVIGGKDGFGNANKVSLKNDVWYSKNGVDWIQATSDAPFLPRQSHTSVVYENKMWVLGGSDAKANKIGDVWCSENGVAWKPVLEDEFLKRAAHTTTIFDKKIWFIAGIGSTTQNDVWVLK